MVLLLFREPQMSAVQLRPGSVAAREAHPQWRGQVQFLPPPPSHARARALQHDPRFRALRWSVPARAFERAGARCVRRAAMPSSPRGHGPPPGGLIPGRATVEEVVDLAEDVRDLAGNAGLTGARAT